VVWPSDFGGKVHEYFDSFIVIWVLVSVVAVVLESVESIHFLLNVEFVILDTVAVGIFTTEYLMRMYSVVELPAYRHAVLGRIRFGKTGMAMIDFLAVVPFFLEALLHHLFDLRFLRVFRLLRLLKLTRYTGATNTLVVVIKREWPVMGASCFIMLLLVVLTASLGYLFEHEAQPDKFENIPTSIYWAVITLASVGYGDISPVTPAGRAMTIVLALLGIGIFAIPAALLSSAFSDQLRIERESLQAEMLLMMGDGVISEEERGIIDSEAKRLHLSKEEVDRLLAKAQREYEADGKGGGAHSVAMNFTEIAGKPQMAAQCYRELLSKICQLNLAVADKEGGEMPVEGLTGLEREVWGTISSEMKKVPGG
jgi:voltage-gated potassium channel Kch